MALGGGKIMWKYEKTLQYPIDIKKKDLRMAKYLVTQYGGANCKRDISYNIFLTDHFFHHIQCGL